MKYTRSVGISTQLVCAATALVASISFGRADSNSEAPPTAIETVVVTAERRQTDLQRTPQSVSVLTGAIQRERGQTGLDDLKTTVPNVNFAATSNVSQLYIRGIGDTFINAGGDPGVAFYQDGAYVSDQETTNTSLFDVDRVEILRGPQGALYGRNAVGGAINIISAQPTDSFHANVNALLGDFGRHEVEGFVSGPLGIADTNVRLSYQLKQLDGYTNNQLAGQPGAPNRLDDLDSQAFRIQTQTNLPTDGSLGIIFSHYRESENGSALSVVPNSGYIYPTQAIFGLVPGTDPRSVQANVGSSYLEVSTVNVTYIQPIGDNTLTVLGNYRDSHQTFLNDCDGTAANACTYYRDTTSQDYYGDVHFASPNDDRLRWLIGATYLHFDQAQLNHVTFLSLMSYLDPLAPPDEPFPLETKTGGTLATNSVAAYADLRFQIDTTWAITGQIRYTQTNKDAVQFEIIPAFGLNSVGYTGPGSSLTNTSVPFKFGVEGQLTDQIFVYASYATAHKDGAINLGSEQAAPVKPEQVRSWEIGEKGNFLNNRLQVNSAIFDMGYDNLQISHVFQNQVALANAPKSSIRGAEIEIIAVPFQGLTLSANAGYLDAKFTEFSNGRVIPGFVAGPLMNLAGNQLPYVSRATVNVDAAYEFALTDGYWASVDLQYSWHDRVFFSEFNDLSNSQPAVGQLNISASLSPEGGRWKLYGYVHNLTNETILAGSTVYSGSLGAEKAVSYEPPRLFGVGVSLTW